MHAELQVYPAVILPVEGQSVFQQFGSRARDLVSMTHKERQINRMIARYVRLTWSMPSQLGTIHETRLESANRLDIDFDGSPAEVLDHILAAMIRRAVTAPPARRTDVRNANGTLMRCVAPRREVAQILSLKPTHPWTDGTSLRQWSATIAAKLHRVGSDGARLLLAAAVLRDELLELGNQLEGARRDVERLRRGIARRLRRLAEQRCAILRQNEREKVAALLRIVRSPVYERAIEALYAVCTETAEIESYCFRQPEYGESPAR